MMNIISPNKLVKAAIVSSSILALIAGGQATIMYTADFSGMSTGADGETNLTGAESNTHASVINQMNANPSGSDLTWQSMKLGYSDHNAGAYRSSLSIDDDGVNQALLVSSAVQLSGGEETMNSFRGVVAKLPTVATLSNVGDYLKINLTGWFGDTPASTSAAIRMGFAMDDSTGLDSIASYIGAGGNTGLSTRWSANDKFGEWGGASGDASGSTGGDAQSLGTDVFAISFSIELIEAGKYEMVTIVDDGTGKPEARKRITTITDDVDRNFAAFDSFGLRVHGVTTDLYLDDVVIAYVPEPSVPLMLGSLLCGTLLYRRRV